MKIVKVIYELYEFDDYFFLIFYLSDCRIIEKKFYKNDPEHMKRFEILMKEILQ